MDADTVANTLTVLDELVRTLREFMSIKAQINMILNNDKAVLRLGNLNGPDIYFSIDVNADVKCPDDALLAYLSSRFAAHMWCKPNETARINSITVTNNRIDIAVGGHDTDSIYFNKVEIHDLLILAIIEEQTKVFERILELAKNEIETHRKVLEELKEIASIVGLLVAGDEK